ncbi:hypothetical protein ACFVS2_26090 [Brevibacillus sp. NPDC058079]|uniref:hypothetical protein n=1 Tax=Brevibacillus sp. NPDC058079 TaxID=3346330 RepID=UPI0036E74845
MNTFDIQATRMERTFVRKIQNEMHFTTGAGKNNFLVDSDSQILKIRTEFSTSTQSISRKRLRKAISFLLFKKTATRKELERYSHMNSSLMGLLQRILIQIAKITRTAKGLLRITIKGVRFFFSGLDRASISDLETVVKSGGRHILCSYYYLRQQNNQRLLDYISQYGLQLLLDSGEYSAYKAREKGKAVDPITISEYAAFVQTYKKYIFGYFNMDVTNNPEKSKQNFDTLKKLTGIAPIPIWHCNIDNWKQSDWITLDNLVNEDHAVIGIGATVHMGLKAGPRLMNEVKDQLFKEIFKRHPLQNFHWLGGSSKILFKYPLFSSDSSGYLQGRKKNQLYFFDGVDISTRIDDWRTDEQCFESNVQVLSNLEEMTLYYSIS